MSEVKEKSCLVSIATSLTQLPSVEKVKMTVGNKNIKTLGGNFDISKPFSKSEIVRIEK